MMYVYLVIVHQKSPRVEHLDTVHDNEESALIRADYLVPKYKSNNVEVLIERSYVYDLLSTPDILKDEKGEDNDPEF